MNIEAPVSNSEATKSSSLASHEAPFDLAQIIYSRSDARGVVQSANPAFASVAGYDFSDLDGAPHKILRHADMPKAVFWLFWDRIQSGKPVGAYVKNRTKSGRYYWVYALVHPHHGGYVSLHFKPTTGFLEKIRVLYSELRQAETSTQKHSPEQSADLLLRKITEMGFADYDAFMANTLSEEMQSRDSKLGRISVVQRKEIKNLEDLASDAERLLAKMSTGFQNIRAEPVNMRILSNRLEGGGGPISSIAQNYEVMAKEMGDDLAQLENGDVGILDAIRQASVSGHFAVLAADLAEEAVRELGDLSRGRTKDGPDLASEMRILNIKAQSLREEANVAIRTINDRSTKLLESCRSLRRRVNGLDVVKLMCRVESGRLENFDASLLGIIDRLDRFHGEIDTCLAQVGRQALQINRIARSHT